MSDLDPQNWLIRAAEPQELSFIYATWLNSYKENSALGSLCRRAVFYQHYPQVIDVILEKAETLVAYFPEAPTVLLSYLVFEFPSTIHYVFTKEHYRDHGLAKSLIGSAFGLEEMHLSYTHHTRMAEPILMKHEKELSFNPFSLYKTIKLNKETLNHER